MPARTSFFPDDSDSLRDALDASGIVGVWSHDVWAGRIAVSGLLAEILGFAPETEVVSLDAFLTAIHDEDRSRMENALHAATEGGGLFEIVFRTVRGERRLGLRGRVERDGSGECARGLGIVIDHTEDGALPHQPDMQAQAAANRMAEHAIALQDLATGLHQPKLTALLDALMREIGFTLAGHIERGERRRDH
ncbi:PAS domain-containing protein [Methylobacterium sp. CM6247]